jgi:hypothetical protein
MERLRAWIAGSFAVMALTGLVAGASAQQASPTQQGVTIDCPSSAAAQTPTGSGSLSRTPGASAPSGAIGSPQGAGTGSGLATLPTAQAHKRIEGEIKSIDSTRTNRIIEVGDVRLEVEPSTVILVDCQKGSTADLKEGTKVKAAYEVKSDNRNLATVIEAEK